MSAASKAAGPHAIAVINGGGTPASGAGKLAQDISFVQLDAGTGVTGFADEAGAVQADCIAGGYQG